MRTRQIGVISDTHGLLRPEAVAALADCVLILHAGDVGKPVVLEELSRIAPVVAVRGNNDKGDWARALPITEIVDLDGVLVYVIHDVSELDLDLVAGGFRVIVSGHSHRPGVREESGVVYLNPGSAGPRRFKLPISVARLRVCGRDVQARIVTLG